MPSENASPRGLELDAGVLRELAERALDWILRYLEGGSDAPILPAASPRDILSRFREPLPEEGLPPARVLEIFETEVAPNATYLQHSGNFAYVPNSSTFVGVIADALASALNQNVSLIRGGPSAAAIEEQVVSWLKELLGYSSAGDGVLTSGGSMANLMGLALARERTARSKDPVYYVSSEIHSSVHRALRFLGIGSSAVRPVKTDAYHRINPAPLAEAVAWDRNRGRDPAVLVASAGTISSGAVDPLDELADLCEEEGIWLHVDGAYGALAAAAPSGAWMRSGLARADSLSLDPHKWLFVPIDTSCLLVRDPVHLRSVFTLVPEYLKVSGEETGVEMANPMERTIELTRRFRALRIWMTLKIYGAAAIRERIEEHLRLARRLAAWVRASPRWELLAPVMTSNVCFRAVPAAADSLRGGARRALLDRANQEIIDRLNRSQGLFVSHTRLEGDLALRVCITHLRTREEDVARLWKRLGEIAAEVESEIASGRIG